jgi:hypothetical protein
MNNPVGGGRDWTEVWVATTTKANDFAAHTVFLCGEFQSNECRGEQLFNSGGGFVESEVSKVEFDILEGEGLPLGGSSCTILPRS